MEMLLDLAAVEKTFKSQKKVDLIIINGRFYNKIIT